MAGDGKGNIALVWQGVRAGHSVILLKLWNGKTWTKEEAVSQGRRHPAKTAQYLRAGQRLKIFGRSLG